MKKLSVPLALALAALTVRAEPLTAEDVALFLRLATVEHSVGAPLTLQERLCVDNAMDHRPVDDGETPAALRSQYKLRQAFERCRIAHASPPAVTVGPDIESRDSEDYRLLPQVRERFVKQLARLSGTDKQLSLCLASETSAAAEACLNTTIGRTLTAREMAPFLWRREVMRSSPVVQQNRPAIGPAAIR